MKYLIIKKSALHLLIIFMTTSSFAQSAKLLEGDAKKLKGIAKFNLLIDYSNLMVHKETEVEYIERVVQKKEKQKPGKGNEYKETWYANQQTKYPYKFVQSFNKRFSEKQVVVEFNNDNISHTILVEAKRFRPRRGSGPAKLNFILSVKDAKNETLVSINYMNVLGNGPGSFNMVEWIKIEEGFAKLAKEFAHYMIRKIK